MYQTPEAIFLPDRHSTDVTYRESACVALGYLEERGEDVEGVDGARAVRVRHQLADVATPRLLGVVAHRRLERRQDGREERGGGRREAQVLQVVHVVTETAP